MILNRATIESVHILHAKSALERLQRPVNTYASLTSEPQQEYISRMLELRERAEAVFIDRVANMLGRNIRARTEITDTFRARGFLMFMSASYLAGRDITSKLKVEYPALNPSDYAAWNIFSHGHSPGHTYAGYDLPDKLIEKLYKSVIAGTEHHFKIANDDIYLAPWFIDSPAMLARKREAAHKPHLVYQ